MRIRRRRKITTNPQGGPRVDPRAANNQQIQLTAALIKMNY